jgi:hypothetical protein
VPARTSVPGGRYNLIPDRSCSVCNHANRPNRIDEVTDPQFEPHQVFRGAALRFVLPATGATLRGEISYRCAGRLRIHVCKHAKKYQRQQEQIRPTRSR